jgi:hypothetical protein
VPCEISLKFQRIELVVVRRYAGSIDHVRPNVAQSTRRPSASLSPVDPRGSANDVATDATPAPLSPRLRRTLELVYGVEGVLEARIWQWPGRIAVGVRGGQGTSPTDLVRRVEVAVAGIREPEEAWDFGILGDSPAG